jgi:ATP-dependent protease ClpP protease subunit
MTTKKLNRKVLSSNKTLGADSLSPIEGMLQPAVYSGLQEKQEYILFFNDQIFQHDTIESIICVLEDVRISDSYDRIKIFISSIGGLAHQLAMLADYLNEYPLDITFKVHGDISSCGSLLPVMVKHASIEYSPTASAMFHLAHQNIHSSALYDTRSNMYGASADLKSLTDLNDYLYDNYYSKLDLTEEELEHIRNGKDVYIDNSRIEHIFETFKERQFYEEDFNEVVEIVEERIDELKAEIERLEDHKTELYIGLEKFDDEFGLFGEDDFKVGCTD